MNAESEINEKERFAFGSNWLNFLKSLSDERIAEAEKSLLKMLGEETLRGRTFLNIGSGSGLFSLTARRLGAKVRSFDYDPQSVKCTEELKRRYFDDDPDWEISEGNALDSEWLASFGEWDIVYSWGVLHHTGDMWTALGNVAELVKPGGALFISIYNDQGRRSRIWSSIKKRYNAKES
ncbi:MAG: class I SAM-dependent methyltransferase [Synergistaceae bacterium]|nr:class I SAM-dependent methyltransferase [Synergistaceae bacterium]